MKNKLKNGIMLTILASAIIACNGGSGSTSSQPQPPSPNVQLPEPEVLDSTFSEDMSKVGSKGAPFLASSAAAIKAFIPGLGNALAVAQLGAGLINLFDPGSGFVDVLKQLNQISNQMKQLNKEVVTEINITNQGFFNTITSIEEFQTSTFFYNLGEQLSTINKDYSTINTAYGKFQNEDVFGNVRYSNAIESMYWNAYSKCNTSQIVNEVVEFQKMSELGSVNFNSKYIDDGYYWDGFDNARNNYISIITQSVESDIYLRLSNYNVGAFYAMSQLFAAFDEMRLMQLAQAAYYYACPSTINSSNLSSDFLSNLSNAGSITIDSTAVLSGQAVEVREKSYESVARFIYTAYDNDFQKLKNAVGSHLKPFSNQYLVESVINGDWFSSIGTPLLTSSFDETASLGAIPNNVYNCNINRFTVAPLSTIINMSAICLMESNSMEYIYRIVNHQIPIKVNPEDVKIGSTYGYANLYYNESRQTIKSPATNLTIPVSSNAPGYVTSPSSIVPTGVFSLTNPYTIKTIVESDIFVFNTPWTNFPTTANECGSSTAINGFTALTCAGADLLVNICSESPPMTGNCTNQTYGYSTTFYGPIFSVSSYQSNANMISTTQAYYYASYKGHLFAIQFLSSANYNGEWADKVWMAGTGQVYIALRCMDEGGSCNALSSESQQVLTWADGTQIAINSSLPTNLGYHALKIQVNNVPNNVVTRKLFQFESDSLVADWVNNPTHLHHKAYLTGRIKYTLKAGVESMPIFVSKNYAYRLAYIASSNGGSLQIQSNNNDGTWTTTSTVATAPNGATDLYLRGGDIMLVNNTSDGESVVWSVSQQYRSNNIQWAPDVYAEVMVTNHGQLNIYAYDKNNQAGVSGISPDDANYTRMLWSSSNFPWLAVNHGTLLLPQGSYLQTCNSVKWAQPILSASCLNSFAKLTSTTLDYYSCSRNSTVSNQNGILTCDTPK